MNNEVVRWIMCGFGFGFAAASAWMLALMKLKEAAGK